jgi:hypothetical protein
MPESHLRAADADRLAVATALGEHMSAGRLTLAEYDERVARAYAARTLGELADLTADLPGTGIHPVADPAPARPLQARSACGPAGSGRHVSARQAWGAWLGTAVIVTTIWLLTSLSAGSLDYFWPMWVVGPWGAVLLAQRLGGGRRAAGH